MGLFGSLFGKKEVKETRLGTRKNRKGLERYRSVGCGNDRSGCSIQTKKENNRQVLKERNSYV